jgi:hypothetical protein
MNFCKTTGCQLAACALSASLGTCGGSIVLAAALSAAPGVASAATATLLDDDGHPTLALPDAVPARADETTRAGLYALRDQALALERALGGDVVWIDDRCCNDDHGRIEPDLALGMAAGDAAARGLGANAPVFIAVSDRRQGAALADRFTASGYTRVFLVTE